MTNEEYKGIIIQHLLENGFYSFAERFNDLKFYVTEMYNGSYCCTAFMSPTDNCIVINPGFFELNDPNDPAEREKAMKQVSVLIRHELMHFLLSHEKRFVKYLKQRYPNSWGRVYANPTMHRIANFAMDYDLCNEGYTDEDKQVIRTLSRNGQLLGGLITEEQVNNDHTSIWFDNGTKEDFSGSQFNGWEKKPMEDMWQMLSDAHQKYTSTPAEFEPGQADPNVKPEPKKDKSELYYKMYDKVFNKFKNDPKAAAELFGRLMAGEINIDVDSWKI